VQSKTPKTAAPRRGWAAWPLDDDADKVRLQLGEPAVARPTEQLDPLAGALRL